MNMPQIEPIRFTPEMVSAILDGHKSVTRQVIRGIDEPDEIVQWNSEKDTFDFYFNDPKTGKRLVVHEEPLYFPGDTLWVKEMWDRYVDGKTGNVEYIYKTHCQTTKKILDELPDIQINWRSSANMPRDAARIFLRVTDVHPERLQEISDQDTLNEGISPKLPPVARREDFETIWNATLKPSERNRFGWNANPWVWVIRFVRVEKPK